MPYPSSSLATLRPDLAASFEEFNLAADRAGFIGLRALPVLEVAQAAGNFGRIPIAALLQTPDTTRAPGGGYNRGRFAFTPDSFATVEHGWEEPVDDGEAAILRLYFDAEQHAAQRAMDFVLRAQEIRAAALLFNVTTWTGPTLTTAVTVDWTAAHHATATPVADVMAAKLRVWQNCGMWPNTVILNRALFNHLRQADEVKDYIAARGAGAPIRASEVTAQMMASVFDVDEVLIAGCAYNSANEGQAVTFTQIWATDYCSVARICKTNDVREPGVGRTFHWGSDGSDIGGTIETYRAEDLRSDVVRVRNQTHEKLLYTQCQHLLTNCNGGA
jgi:hypothetical protein